MNRAYRRLVAVGTAGMLLLGATACAGSSAAPAASPTPVAESSATPATPSPSATPDPDTSWATGPIRFDRAATTAFGEAGSREGAETALDFVRDYLADETQMRSRSPQNERLLLAMRRRMLPGARRDWTETVRKSLHGTEKQEKEENGAFYATVSYAPFDDDAKHEGKRIALRADGPAAVDRTISRVKVTTTEDRTHLEVRLHASMTLRMTLAGKPTVAKVDRDLKFWMLPKADGWYIDGWYGKYTFGKIRPDRSAR